jgi:LysM repeat protein
MRQRASVLRGNSKCSLLLSASAAVFLSACSSDMERLADNPTEGDDSIYTASISKSVQGGTASAVSGRPLASAGVKLKPGYASNGYNYQKSYPQLAYRQPQDQAKPQIQSQTERSSAIIRIEPGMTLYSIARVNNLSVGELASANGIKPPYSVHIGQTLHVPGVAAAITPQPRQAEVEPAYAKPAQSLAAGSVHTVRSGETLFSLGRTYGVHPYKIADINHLPHNVSLSVGQAVRIPSGGSAKIATANPKGQKRIVATNEQSGAQPQIAQTQPPALQTGQPPRRLLHHP